MSAVGDIFVQSGLFIPQEELSIRACRSSGAGGQHVNKTSTKIQLTWSPSLSEVLSDEQRERILSRLANRISRAGFITCSCDESRSQQKNIELARECLAELIRRALHVPKERKATKPTKGSKERRIKTKKQRGEVKAQRQKRHWD
jgi:ribosome-associated protein